MLQQKTHDLYGFMQQVSVEMSAEYDRIQMRATEDPGAAGDQGEENWAELRARSRRAANVTEATYEAGFGSSSRAYEGVGAGLAA